MDRIELGFEPYVITVMFNPLTGSSAAVARNMDRAVEDLYSIVVQRMFRRPKEMPLLSLPLWITCPDFPVQKLLKTTLADARVNNGAHMHIPALSPPNTRLDLPFNLWLDQNKTRYSGPGHAIARIYVQRVYETPENAFDYALKSLGRGRATSDDVLVLPRTRSEIHTRRGSQEATAGTNYGHGGRG
ncbi:hypothetical protein ACLI1C_15345 [Devosia sp. XGJD_8]|uniref:hypothetical protein n=1 Tax=Devosia sp. XGJD_8 TaxID=3391187 RepID=UPI0039849EF8